MRISLGRMRILMVLVAFVCVMPSFGAGGEGSSAGPAGGKYQVTTVQKDDWIDVYVGGLVTEQDQTTPIAGALVTATYRDDDGIGDIYYYDYSPTLNQFIYTTGTASHCTTTSDGRIHLRMDLRSHQAFWEADFDVCVTCPGYKDQCETVNFDYDDDDDNRYFNLVPDVSPTPTLTPEATSTPTPTASISPSPTLSETPTDTPILISTYTPTPTPTLTETPSGNPTAVHPELDVDQDGVIGPGDLILLMRDWLRPVN